ncbi:hypothetical protein K432DRAFT_406598 [Lepidopterella palustris CBS 459.81]|uniref:Zn(2)-C6 fungal-type domain-containing protein n=1 Tax=Lepidopterella palustris CBS 459.81 TaxID=1314670 RepID=A0A8E2JDC0_9PEZI|nr:hypothetical protein K432DRAFT_406598 [Lepidopterella palustris CBS 459.81]
MEMSAVTGGGQVYVSPESNTKHSQHSPPDDENDNWSVGNVSSPGGGAADGQNGSAKRKRPMSVSCELCKQRKVKCDRGQPSCGWCVKNSHVCEYKERKKPGLRAGYGRELEARLDKLEEIIQQQQNQISLLSNSSLSPSQPSPHQEGPIFRSPPIIQTPHIPRPETALFLQKPSTFPSQSSVQSDFVSQLVARGQTPAVGHSNGFRSSISSEDMHSSLRNLGTSDGYTPISPAPFESDRLRYVPPAMPHQLPQPQLSEQQINPQDNDFPPYDLLYALADLFFKHISPWCPILHRQSTLNSLFGPSSLDDADRILLHAIVATTLRFSSDTRLTPESRERYHQTSKEKVLLYGMENSSVKSLQALVILALDLVGCSNGPPGWNMLALITRSVVQLGLATESYSPMVVPQHASIYTLRAMVLPEPKDWIEEESRRRLFWGIYILDRYATVATAFEFALDEKEIDRRLPCRDDLFGRNIPVETRWFQTSSRSDYSMNKAENLGSFSYYVEIIGILSRIHKFLKKIVDISSLSDVEKWQGEYRELDNAVETWKYNLPNEYGNASRIFTGTSSSKNINIGWVMLHAAFQTVVIRLHSSAAYPTHRSPIFTPSFSASQRCLSAVENILSLCAFVRDNGMLTKLGPPFAFSLWVAARVLLVHGSTIDHQVNPNINILVSTLREMGRYWEVGTRYANLLSRVLNEYQESQRAPAGADGERVTPSTVKILADMRRCAFDLDFLISRQPKHHATRAVSVAPVRTPAPNELEYLDVFDFFNMPRLPISMDGPMSFTAGTAGDQLQIPEGGASNEFNITNYMIDASSDWFMKNQN